LLPADLTVLLDASRRRALATAGAGGGFGNEA